MATGMAATQGVGALAGAAKDVSDSPASSATGGKSGDISNSGSKSFGNVNIVGSKRVSGNDNSSFYLGIGAAAIAYYFFFK